jgi:hypothetical protein
MVRMVSEVVQTKQKILILQSRTSVLQSLLKKHFVKYDAEVFVSAQAPARLDQFDYIFLIDFDHAYSLMQKPGHNPRVAIFTKSNPAIKHVEAILNTVDSQDRKLVELDGANPSDDDLERLLWFIFSQTDQRVLKMRVTPTHRGEVQKSPEPIHLRINRPHVKRKQIFITAVLVILFILLLPFPFLAVSTYQTTRAFRVLDTGDFKSVQTDSNNASSFLTIGRKIYEPLRPIYFLFSVGFIPESIFNADAKALTLLGLYNQTNKDADELLHLVVKKNKSTEEKVQLTKDIDDVEKNAATLEDQINDLTNAIPDSFTQLTPLEKKLTAIGSGMTRGRKLLSTLKSLLAKDTTKTYLVLLADNRVLRPGGGVVTALGVLTVSDMNVNAVSFSLPQTIDRAQKGTTEPAPLLKTYTHATASTFADLTISPEFTENYDRANALLAGAGIQGHFDGSLLITYNGLRTLLEAFPSIHLTEPDEKITSKNILVKSDIYHDQSHFYDSLAAGYFDSLRNAKMSRVAPTILKVLDEKQLQFITGDEKVEQVFNAAYWSGTTISPRCVIASVHCIVDYIYPIEINMGGNAINPFISKNLIHSTRFTADGTVENTVNLTIRNNLTTTLQPSPDYYSYIQLLLPDTASIISLTKNNTTLESSEILTSTYKLVGFPILIKPGQSATINLKYRLITKLEGPTSVYQIIVQKQTGSSNSDFQLEMRLPPDVSVVNQNFTPVVNDSKLIYNTNLSADKLFIIELTKR